MDVDQTTNNSKQTTNYNNNNNNNNNNNKQQYYHTNQQKSGDKQTIKIKLVDDTFTDSKTPLCQNMNVTFFRRKIFLLWWWDLVVFQVNDGLTIGQ